MGSCLRRRSPTDQGLLPCPYRRSRRALRSWLYRASIFVAMMMFFAFQFLATTENRVPWPGKAPAHNVSSNGSRKAPDASLDDVQSDSGYSESFLERIEYAVIKFFVGKVVAAHERRQKAAEAALLSRAAAAEVSSVGDRIHWKPLATISRNGRDSGAIDYEYVNADNSEVSQPEVRREARVTNSTVVSDTPKTIVMYTRFFGRRNWTRIFGNNTDLEGHGCPVSNCVFTYDRSKAPEADALLFHARDFKAHGLPGVRKPYQRYIWMYHEPPGMENAELNQVPDGFFNWTYTYHRDSDLLFLYGGIQPLHEGNPNVNRPGLLDPSGETYREYLQALGQENDSAPEDTQPQPSAPPSPPPPSPDKLENSEGRLNGTSSSSSSSSSSNDPPDQRKLVAWMVSHCNTWSGRELYIQELMQYVDVDIYGKCGPLSCGKTHLDSYCYSEVLATNYKFYLSFENSMCDDYISEKVWYPLHYGLVPVVYGGARYQEFLPPHSYVDATDLTPSQLAKLLIKLGSSSALYNKYHLWRNYWRVMVPPPMCELCHRLHFDQAPSSVKNPQRWWKEVNNCTTRYSFLQYPRHDLRLMVTKVDAGIKLFRKMVESFL
ncbi:alpha-(1,3)-fucosyltransferase C-like [Macrobrachium nipponense]|uniref:alpha-(1,3)-fucosyltransferase C-like n=1 Tax=Macrobrachium nipponense TaxID=159736 RepID=UPI0030C8A273